MDYSVVFYRYWETPKFGGLASGDIHLTAVTGN